MHFCLLHAPDKLSPFNGEDWPLESRREEQTEYLYSVIAEWRAASKGRRKGQQLSLVLPGIRCGGVDFSKGTGRNAFPATVVFDGAAFEGDVAFEGATFGGDAGFWGVRFAGKTRFDRVVFEGHCGFGGARFADETGFWGTVFSGDAGFDQAKFQKEVKFWGASFSGYARFWETLFIGPARFWKASFEGFAGFDKARFCREAGFDQTVFSGNTRFWNAAFEGKAAFRGTTFSGEARFLDTFFAAPVQFNQVHFIQRADFRKLLFLSTLTLDRLTFGDPFSLDTCRFHQLVYKGHSGEPLAFNHCRCHHIRDGQARDAETGEPVPVPECRFPLELSDDANGHLEFSGSTLHRVVFRNMDLSLADFVGADMEGTRFNCCRWQPQAGERYPGPLVGEGILKRMNAHDADAMYRMETTCREIRRVLEQNRQYDLASGFFYHEMKFRHRSLKYARKRRMYRTLLHAYGLLSDYGESCTKLTVCLMLTPFTVGALVTWFESARKQQEAMFGLAELTAAWMSYTYLSLVSVSPFVFSANMLSASLWERMGPAAVLSIGAGGVAMYGLTAMLILAIFRRFRR